MVAHLTVTDGGAHVTAIRVDMGKPNFARSAVPCTLPSAAATAASLPSKDAGDLLVLEEDYVFEGVTYQFSSLVVGVRTAWAPWSLSLLAGLMVASAGSSSGSAHGGVRR